MGDKTRGLYGKFKVTRTDGQSEPGGKHEKCDYFVLDLSCDPHAIPAIVAYIASCQGEYPQLADDLRAKIDLYAPRNRVRLGGICFGCGMKVGDAREYHPHAACMMFRACGSESTVRHALETVQQHGAAAAQERIERTNERLRAMSRIVREAAEFMAAFEGQDLDDDLDVWDAFNQHQQGLEVIAADLAALAGCAERSLYPVPPTGWVLFC